MSFIIREVKAKSVLTKSGIPGVDYCVNPYTGCFHGCKYCYATFTKRFTGHTEEWGSFVDVKINAPEILRKQLIRAKRGSVLLSSVTDAYQPVESKYRLTRQCLEALLVYRFPVDILTKSPLVLRDIDLLRKFKDAYERMNLAQWLEKGFVDGVIQRLREGFGGKAVSVC